MIETDTVGTNSPLVQIYNFDDIFCGEKTCSQMVNGQLMFEDVNHLTPQGSLLLVDPLKERFRKLIGL
jgi:hypothetical protein